MITNYQFTGRWFEVVAKGIWDQLMPKLNPSRILEVGSYEGMSICYLIEKLGNQRPLDIHCIDTWEGGIEHKQGNVNATDMKGVEARFQHNTALAVQRVKCKVDLQCHKGSSLTQLSKLVANGMQNYFDFIYVDGSHQAPDVLSDAVLGFNLLAIGGVIAFDDYTWSEPLSYGVDPVRCPKMAIDAFTNIHCRKISIIPAPIDQVYLQKIAD